MREISIHDARTRLVRLWFIGCIPLGIIMVVRSSLDHYGSDPKLAWEWFLPTILPTFMLIWTVFFSGSRPDKLVDSFVFSLSWWASMIYILAVFFSLVADPLTTKLPIEFMRMSSLWLAPCQGVVALSIGIFFVKNWES